MIFRILVEEQPRESPHDESITFLLMDIKKAYPNVPWSLCWTVLKKTGAAAANDEHHSVPQQKNPVSGQDAHGGLLNVQVPQGPERRLPEQLRGFQSFSQSGIVETTAKLVGVCDSSQREHCQTTAQERC